VAWSVFPPTLIVALREGPVFAGTVTTTDAVPEPLDVPRPIHALPVVAADQPHPAAVLTVNEAVPPADVHVSVPGDTE
jgi:hypothetical protein